MAAEAGLASLPPGRRDYLLHWLGNVFGADPEQAECLVRAAVAGRCPVPGPDPAASHPALAPDPAGTTPVARIRMRLVATFGPWCAARGNLYGDRVDHDHATGVVRGMLCRWCNTVVDRCPHPAGCPFADYLNSPPALGLRIRYPNRGRPAPVPFDDAVLRARREHLVEIGPERAVKGWTIMP